MGGDRQRQGPPPRPRIGPDGKTLLSRRVANDEPELLQVLSLVTVNCLMRTPLPRRPTPTVAGIDEFALLRGQRYATIIIDADTGQSVEVLPDHKRATVTTWLREHPGIRLMCRDGSGGFAQATTDANPGIVQVGDRWQCAMRRLFVSPTQSGRIRKEILGSDGLPNPETVRGPQHARKATAGLRHWRRGVVGPA